MRLEVERSEGLLVLGKVLAEHVAEGLGLLGAEKDGLVVADGDLVRAFAGSEAKDKLEVPYTDAYLDAVGIGLAIVGGLDETHFGLLRGWTHGFTRLRREGCKCEEAASSCRLSASPCWVLTRSAGGGNFVC